MAEQPRWVGAVLRRVLSEPLLHFLVVGAVIFGVLSAYDKDDVLRPGKFTITDETVGRLSAAFEATWRRPPDQREIAALVEDYIREEIYVREALSLGLDQDDAVIRRRLRQKMEFVATSIAGAMEPTEDDLRQFFVANAENYVIEGAVAIEQIFLGDNAGDGEVEAIRSALASGAEAASLGKRTMLPRELGLADASTVDSRFGPGFYRSVVAQDAGGWHGPLRSSFGLHLVRVTERKMPMAPEFETVRAVVRDDWRRANVERIVDMNFERLRARYEITWSDKTNGE